MQRTTYNHISQDNYFLNQFIYVKNPNKVKISNFPNSMKKSFESLISDRQNSAKNFEKKQPSFFNRQKERKLKNIRLNRNINAKPLIIEDNDYRLKSMDYVKHKEEKKTYVTPKKTKHYSKSFESNTYNQSRSKSKKLNSSFITYSINDIKNNENISNYYITRGEKEKIKVHNFKNQILSMYRICTFSSFRTIFIDCYFPPLNTSIISNELTNKIQIPQENIYWLRLHNIFKQKDIKLYDESHNLIHCINQGWIKNSNVISALIALSKNDFHLIKKIILNEFPSNEGQYKLLFNIKGIPTIVGIDDYFPCLKGTRWPLFMKSPYHNIWPMLIEKALAKVYGCYFKLQKATIDEILQLLYPLNVKCVRVEKKVSVWREIHNMQFNKGIVIGRIENNDKDKLCGLKAKAAYAIDKTWEGLKEKNYYHLIRIKLPVSNMKKFSNSFLTSPIGNNLISELPYNNENLYNWSGSLHYNSPLLTKSLLSEIGNYSEKEYNLGYCWLTFDEFANIFSKIYTVVINYPLYTKLIPLTNDNSIYKIFFLNSSYVDISAKKCQIILVKIKGNDKIEMVASGEEKLNKVKMSKGEYLLYIFNNAEIKGMKNAVINAHCQFLINHCNVTDINIYTSFLEIVTSLYKEEISQKNKNHRKELSLQNGFIIPHTSIGFIILINHTLQSFNIKLESNLKYGYSYINKIENPSEITCYKNSQSVIFICKNAKDKGIVPEFRLVKINPSENNLNCNRNSNDYINEFWSMVNSTQTPSKEVYDYIIKSEFNL